MSEANKVLLDMSSVELLALLASLQQRREELERQQDETRGRTTTPSTNRLLATITEKLRVLAVEIAAAESTARERGLL